MRRYCDGRSRRRSCGAWRAPDGNPSYLFIGPSEALGRPSRHLLTIAKPHGARQVREHSVLASRRMHRRARLNGARATVPGLASLSDPGTPDARVDLTFRERAFWMFMTGHRLGDLRRLVRQYGRGSETVFPTGAYHNDNLVRGTDVNIVIPISERTTRITTGAWIVTPERRASHNERQRPRASTKVLALALACSGCAARRSQGDASRPLIVVA